MDRNWVTGKMSHFLYFKNVGKLIQGAIKNYYKFSNRSVMMNKWANIGPKDQWAIFEIFCNI